MSDILPTLNLSGTGYCASLNFRRTARAVTRLYDQAFQKFGVRSTQFTILIAIAKTQPVSIGKLGQILVIDRTTLTRSLRLMQKQAHVTVSERSTKRQRFVSLTVAGEKVLAQVLPEWRKVQDRFVRAVGADYWLKFRDELEQLSTLASGLGPEAASLPSVPQPENPAPPGSR